MELRFTEDIYRYIHSRKEDELLEEFQKGTLLGNLDISSELNIYAKLNKLNKNDIESFKKIIKELNENKDDDIEFITDFDKSKIIFTPNEEFKQVFQIDIKYSNSELRCNPKEIVKSENIKIIKVENCRTYEGGYLKNIFFEINFSKGTPQGYYYEYIAFPKEFNAKTYTFSLKCDGGYTFANYPKNLTEFGEIFNHDSEKALELFNNEEFKHWLRHHDKSVNKIDNKLEASLYDRVNNNKLKRSVDELREFLKIIEIVSLDKKEYLEKPIITGGEYSKQQVTKKAILESHISKTMGISGKIKITELLDMSRYKYQIINNNDIYICIIKDDGSVVIKQDISPIQRSKIKLIEGIKSKSSSILKNINIIKEIKQNNDKLSLLREDILKANQKIHIRAIPNDKKEDIKVYTIEILRK